jgi:hypothetical protein
MFLESHWDILVSKYIKIILLNQKLPVLTPDSSEFKLYYSLNAKTDLHPSCKVNRLEKLIHSRQLHRSETILKAFRLYS